VKCKSKRHGVAFEMGVMLEAEALEKVVGIDYYWCH